MSAVPVSQISQCKDIYVVEQAHVICLKPLNHYYKELINHSWPREVSCTVVNGLVLKHRQAEQTFRKKSRL